MPPQEHITEIAYHCSCLLELRFWPCRTSEHCRLSQELETSLSCRCFDFRYMLGCGPLDDCYFRKVVMVLSFRG